ncbi:MAG: hypothetical protein QGD89_00420 [Actinomycetota bacterium]|nr:hypothetical protein [Actinomycetota bacterium]
MLRVTAAAAALAVFASACTSSAAAPTTTVEAATATLTPLTTLVTLTPVTPTTSTTGPPSTTTTRPVPENECEVASVAGVDGYAQGCTVLGIEVLAAAGVDPEAIRQLADRVHGMLVNRPEYAAAIASHPIGVRVIGADQRITDLPEFTRIYFHHPGTDWHRLGRSFPGTELIPYAAGAAENLLCSDIDRFEGEDNFLRAFAITIRRYAMAAVDTATSRAIEQAYSIAIAEGKWTNTLAEINSEQYWAEGVQSFFDANLQDDAQERKPISSHNHVNTREELRTYDRALWEIAVSVFGDAEWRPGCGALISSEATS